MGTWGRWGVGIAAGAALLILAWLSEVVSPDAGSRTGESRPTTEAAMLVGDTELTRLLPRELSSLTLGMSVAKLRTLRPAVTPLPELSDDGVLAYGERLAESQALYLFDRPTSGLTRVQLARQLASVNDIDPHVRALQRSFGAPSGVWDCNTGASAPPTRRMSWFRVRHGLVEAFLIAGERVLVTRYVASADTLRTSLATAHCEAVPPERFAQFPVSPPTR